MTRTLFNPSASIFLLPFSLGQGKIYQFWRFRLVFETQLKVCRCVLNCHHHNFFPYPFCKILKIPPPVLVLAVSSALKRLLEIVANPNARLWSLVANNIAAANPNGRVLKDGRGFSKKKKKRRGRNRFVASWVKLAIWLNNIITTKYLTLYPYNI